MRGFHKVSVWNIFKYEYLETTQVQGEFQEQALLKLILMDVIL